MDRIALREEENSEFIRSLAGLQPSEGIESE